MRDMSFFGTKFVLLSVIKFDVSVEDLKSCLSFGSIELMRGASYLFVNMNEHLTILTYENKKRATPIIDMFCLDEVKDSSM